MRSEDKLEVVADIRTHPGLVKVSGISYTPGIGEGFNDLDWMTKSDQTIGSGHFEAFLVTRIGVALRKKSYYGHLICRIEIHRNVFIIFMCTIFWSKFFIR